jgi:hypothetical protein
MRPSGPRSSNSSPTPSTAPVLCGDRRAAISRISEPAAGCARRPRPQLRDQFGASVRVGVSCGSVLTPRSAPPAHRGRGADGGAEQARPLSDLGDASNLDVGEPDGAVGFAFNDATAQQVAKVERDVRAGFGVDSLRAPAEELLVERTSPPSRRRASGWAMGHAVEYRGGRGLTLEQAVAERDVTSSAAQLSLRIIRCRRAGTLISRSASR